MDSTPTNEIIMENQMQSCLKSLHGDISGIADESARQCLTNFINICCALYSAEAEDEHASMGVIDTCRRKILTVHKKSVKVLQTLLNDDTSRGQGVIDKVLQKTETLIDINVALERHFGQATHFNMNKINHGGKEENSMQVSTMEVFEGEDDDEDVETNLKNIVNGLNILGEISDSLEAREAEERTTYRRRSEYLESLRKQAAAHPAIDAYIGRNARSPLAAKARREEYMQYACALERVLTKIRKTTESLRESGRNDLDALEKHLPSLQTLSEALTRLHVSVQDAYKEPEQADNPDIPELPEKTRKDQETEADEARNTLATSLTQAVATVGAMRRFLDTSLGYITAVLDESSGDWAVHLTAEGAKAKGRNGCLASLRWPSAGDDLYAVNTFTFLPLEEKACRRHLIEAQVPDAKQLCVVIFLFICLSLCSETFHSSSAHQRSQLSAFRTCICSPALTAFRFPYLYLLTSAHSFPLCVLVSAHQRSQLSAFRTCICSPALTAFRFLYLYLLTSAESFPLSVLVFAHQR
ncbi:hypothetical protein PoB_002334100 [Plakobranchus ocellatus]|uniref:Uncharacterized protein n=1 Tax=Plakobranchus ocellatus TaxID=259542 RepID=A0AAV3ZQQ0_9GAST|nr:hypothetical protein PoB_002334100 [Plakobranchus ocellatus]